MAAGIKADGGTDVGLLVCDADEVRSSLALTANASAAAPVRVCRELCDADSIRGLVVNSGNANASTGQQGYADAVAMRAVVPDAELRIWSRTPAHAEALALEAHATVSATVEEALDGAEIVCTCTSARDPIVRLAWLAPGSHLNVVGSSIAVARELDADVVAASALFVDRRESTLNEGGDYLMAVEEAGIGVLSSCAEGTCGTCETPVLSGRPDHRDSVLTEEERRADDCMLICVSRSCTDRLVLDL